MAARPVFIMHTKSPLVTEKTVTFDWYPGFAMSQKQKSISSLHEHIEQAFGLKPILEVSTKSQSPLGVSLSAFNLKSEVPGIGLIPLESAFQGSKVFLNAGSCRDLYRYDPRSAKTAARERDNGDLQSFEFDGRHWELEPKTAFYDWLYIRSLYNLPTDALSELLDYQGFTDIEFNPERSFNCQARSCALASALLQSGQLEAAMESEEQYLAIISGEFPTSPGDTQQAFVQPSLL